jgi:hypothetical protein
MRLIPPADLVAHSHLLAMLCESMRLIPPADLVAHSHLLAMLCESMRLIPPASLVVFQNASKVCFWGNNNVFFQ